MKRNTSVCNGGCNGGWPWTAFDDLASKASPTHIGGIPYESTDPYNVQDEYTCKPTTGKTWSITGYSCVTQDTDTTAYDETKLMTILSTYGPLSIALNANYFSYYTGGVMDIAGCVGGALNHAVLMVGYGTDASSGKDFWKIKNSWGAAWGEAGYIRIVRNKDMCGLAEAISYPTGAFCDSNC